MLTIWQGHDVFVARERVSSEITFWYFFGFFEQHGIGYHCTGAIMDEIILILDYA